MAFYTNSTTTSTTSVWSWDQSSTGYSTGTWTFTYGEVPQFTPAPRYDYVEVTSYGSPYSEYLRYPVQYDYPPADQYQHPQRYAAEDRATEDAFVAEMQVPESSPRTKARELLIGALSEEQRKEYERNNQFEVIGSKGGRYIIEGHSMVQNVRARSGLRAGRRLCAHPTRVPLEDGLLTQKLLLETDEEAFLAVANG